TYKWNKANASAVVIERDLCDFVITLEVVFGQETALHVRVVEILVRSLRKKLSRERIFEPGLRHKVRIFDVDLGAWFGHAPNRLCDAPPLKGKLQKFGT